MNSRNKQRNRPKRSLVQGVRWWWQTRIKSWWTVRLPAQQQRRLNEQHTIGFQNTPPPLEDIYQQDSQPNQTKSLQNETSPSSNQSIGESSSITAILTLYKRAEYLPAQVEALRNQSVPPKEIWLWCNNSDELIPDMTHLVDRVIISNSNWKFWGRFSLAGLVRTQYIALFDDDILPQIDWLKNCLDTYAAGTEGILGGSGVVLPETGGYSSKHKVGWNGHHRDHPVEVDLVGHAWFIKKTYIKYMWFEEPMSWENGEDIHFSYMALKHAGLSTWVPPHPESKPDLWSCRPDFGKAVGRTNSATFKSTGHHTVRDDIVKHYREDGWKVTTQRQEISDHVHSE